MSCFSVHSPCQSPLPPSRGSRRALLLLLSATLGLAVAVACSSGDEPIAGIGDDQQGSCEDGEVRDCGVELARNGTTLVCYDGVQHCEGGVWSACDDGRVVSYPTLSSRGLAPKSLTSPEPCRANPCDPHCRAYYETPDAAIATEQGDLLFTWSNGDLMDFPPGLVTKGLVTPCNSGYDCQFNHRCVEPITHPECAHSKCEPGVALAADCEDAYAGKEAPACVRQICDVMPRCCGSSYAGDCDHDPCDIGAPLKDTCEPCMAAVCANEPSCCGSATASASDPVMLEAEDHTGGDLQEGGSSWTEVLDAAASAGKAMEATPDNGKFRESGDQDKGPRLDFEVTLARTGRWYVWVRGLANGSSAATSDSCHVGLDGSLPSTADRIAGFDRSYGWADDTMDGSDVPYLDVSAAGTHTINLWMREDGFRVDRIVLTQDAALVPSGLGPGATGPGAALLAPEAEDYTGGVLDRGGNEWVERSASDASAETYMRVEPDDGTRRDASNDYRPHSPRLDYELDFPSAGRWYVFVRGRADGNNSDSLHVGLDGSAINTSDRISGFGTSWTWSVNTMDNGNVPYFDVSSAGTHTVNVWMREAGMEFDRLVLSQDANYRPAGTGPSTTGGSGSIPGVLGIWSATCVELYAAECGADCSAGEWTQACVDAVGTVCDATCGQRPEAPCEHNVCDTGEALDGRCHPCVAEICATSPLCCIDEWDSACAQRAESVCGLECPDAEMFLRPPESGRCETRLPGDLDETCAGIDLAVGVPCDGIIPVCNHGTEEAPANIRVLHFPANSQQYPKTAPNESHPQMEECFTSAPIPPGHCTNVEDCPGLNGNREIMVNPESTGLDECSRLDNWSLYSNTTAECEVPVCSESDTTAQFTDTTLYFIMDKSGSMRDDAKWTKSVSALKAFFASEDAAGIQVAFELYPAPSGGSYGDGCGSPSVGECDARPCSHPMVPADFLTNEPLASDSQEQALSAALDPVWPDGYTPTYAALDGTLQRALADHAASPNDFYAVILVTDGEPTKCEQSTNAIAELALGAYLDAGVRTYTIGMEGANTDALDVIARAGGTRSAFVVGSGSNVETDLLEALLSIARSVARCEFTVENGLYINPNDATVTYRPGDGSDPEELVRVDGVDACGDGWYYDDPDDPTSAVLCPTTCDTIQADGTARVEVEIGCAEPYEEASFNESYEASCPDGAGPQWGMFTFDSELEIGAEILFEARVATTAEDLADAEWIELGRATDTVQTCGYGGPAPVCPVNVYEKLGGGVETHWPELELRATLSPNATRTSRAALNSWEITFTCLDNE